MNDFRPHRMKWTPERWKRADALVEALLDLDADARTAYLDAHCTDAGLRADVEALLAQEPEARTLFQQDVRHFALPLVPDAPEAALPYEQIGPYRLVEAIGRGGMGTVYRAERADGAFEQQVAIKIVHQYLSADTLRRFHAERHILARLQHPSIARLLDGGQTSDDRPFFVLEYVDGQPITTYAERQGLSVDDRLNLFIQVCEAVRYAHQNLVVHRDLKPSNILVTPEGRVKLLDFGIAKLLDEGEVLPMTAPLTQEGSRWLTPDYASPEQVKGEAITTASDVYQLGVLLYELLTGRRPYQLPERLRHEAARIILETQPERPSTAVTKVQTGTPTTTALDPTRLRRRLQGDLDVMVLTALRKEPTRRYASAEALALDLQRHLDGLPVQARPDSLGYRARKFVQRNRLGVGVAAVILLAALGAAGAILDQSRQVRDERDRAEAALAFMNELFKSANPEHGVEDETNRTDVTVREALQLASNRVQRELGDQPMVQTTVAGMVARNLYGLGDSTAADAIAYWGDLTDQHADPFSKDARGALIFRSHLLRNAGDYAAAESLMAMVIDRAERSADATVGELASAYNDMAGIYFYQGRPAEDRFRYYRKAIALYRTDSTYAGDVATISANMADALPHDAPEKEALVRETIAIWERIRPADHPDIALGYYHLARVEMAKGDTALGLAYSARNVAMNDAAYGADNNTALFFKRRHADLLYSNGRRAESVPIFRDILSQQQQAEVPDLTEIASTMQSLAKALPQTPAGDAERLDLFASASALFRDAKGPNDYRVAVPLVSAANTLHRLGRNAEAVAATDRAMAILPHTLGPEHDLLLFTRFRRATALLGDGQRAVGQAELTDVCDTFARLERTDQVAMCEEAQAEYAD
ncbi:MAG: serine/threonine-protein kinase [Bacteroidota bacterium]